jgi:hypothetical protein
MTGAIVAKAPGSATGVGRQRLDVKKLMTHHLAPFEIWQQWRDAFELAQGRAAILGRNARGELYALREPESRPGQRAQAYDVALEVQYQLPRLDEVRKVIGGLSEIMRTAPDEPTVRLLLGTMLDGFRVKPAEGAPVYLDALVWVLEGLEPGEGELYARVPTHVPAAAIAASTKEAWVAQTFPPSIHEFVVLVRKHRRRLTDLLARVRFLERTHADCAEIIAANRTDNETVHRADHPDEAPF